GDNSRVPAFGDRQKVVGLRGRLDGVKRNAGGAASTVFEPYRARQTRGQLAVDLAFGRTGTNGTPGDQVGYVLGGDHVEVFATGRQTQLVDIQQQLARSAQALIDVKATVQIRIVDQA